MITGVAAGTKSIVFVIGFTKFGDFLAFSVFHEGSFITFGADSIVPLGTSGFFKS
mgnify:CR=1 FL=1